jgi:hypothetical protein
MATNRSRRDLLTLGRVAIPAGYFGFSQAPASAPEAAVQAVVTDLFPTQPSELAREMVTVAHFDLKRVRELVEARPFACSRIAWATGRLPSI